MRSEEAAKRLRVCGVIAEYDPFHTGHAFHLAQARRMTDADFVVCVISCAFTQRGTPAMFSTHARARMALQNGADLVLGMPYSFGTAQANRFALGGISILNSLCAVTHISFGVEKRSLPLLYRAAEVVGEGAGFREQLRDQLKQGKSFARSHGEALSQQLGEDSPEAFNAPNFNLALCYLQALKQTGSRMVAAPVARQGDYHESTIGPSPSATAVRAALLRGDWQGAGTAVPESCLSIIKDETAAGRTHHPQALDKHLLAALINITPQRIRNYPEISEGLENRILMAAREAVSREDLIRAIKSKRYTYARISRALTHILVGPEKYEFPDHPTYARLLGFSKGAAPLLKAIGQSGFPLVSRPAKNMSPLFHSDMLAEQLWVLGAGLPSAGAFREQVIII